MNKKNWTPESWQDKPCAQAIEYADQQQVDSIVNSLSGLEPLVPVASIMRLQEKLAQVAAEEVFLLQAGDCAEGFFRADRGTLPAMIKLLDQVAIRLGKAIGKPVLTVGRIAGQYAKPRSLLTENQGEQTLPSYRGDLINGHAFNKESRAPNPQRMLESYYSAKAALACIAELAPQEQDFFTSHEALHLRYEQALTRAVNGHHYNLSTHFPWVGMRTAQLDGAHIEYLRGICNPIGVKIGPRTEPKMLATLVEHLNPKKSPGRLMLIHRLGVRQIKEKLPALIEAVSNTGLPVLWCCDPMHGNTYLSDAGEKRRAFEDIVLELSEALRIHQQSNKPLNGLHVELTGEHVHECIGGLGENGPIDSASMSRPLVDPRLNKQQSLALIEAMAKFIEERNGGTDRSSTN